MFFLYFFFYNLTGLWQVKLLQQSDLLLRYKIKEHAVKPLLIVSIQSRLPSPSNTHSSPSTSTGSGRLHSLWRPLRACGLSAATTAGKACRPTPTATPSCSGSSMLVCATGSYCPSASCWPAPSWFVPSSCSTHGQPAS